MINISRKDLVILRESTNNMYEGLVEAMNKRVTEQDYEEFKKYISNEENYNKCFYDFYLEKYKDKLVVLKDKESPIYISDIKEKIEEFKKVFKRNAELIYEKIEKPFNLKNLISLLDKLENQTEEDVLCWLDKKQSEIYKEVKKVINENIISYDEIELLKKVSFIIFKTQEDLLNDLINSDKSYEINELVADVENKVISYPFYRTLYKYVEDTYKNVMYRNFYNFYVRVLFRHSEEEAEKLFTALIVLMTELRKIDVLKNIEITYTIEKYLIDTFYKILEDEEKEIQEKNISNFVYDAFGWIHGVTGEEAYLLELFTSLEDLSLEKYINKIELARMVYFGDIKNWNDDYFYIDERGNISSMSNDDFRNLANKNKKNVIEKMEEIMISNNYEKEDIEELKDFYSRNISLINKIKRGE